MLQLHQVWIALDKYCLSTTWNFCIRVVFCLKRKIIRASAFFFYFGWAKDVSSLRIMYMVYIVPWKFHSRKYHCHKTIAELCDLSTFYLVLLTSIEKIENFTVISCVQKHHHSRLSHCRYADNSTEHSHQAKPQPNGLNSVLRHWHRNATVKREIDIIIIILLLFLFNPLVNISKWKHNRSSHHFNFIPCTVIVCGIYDQHVNKVQFLMYHRTSMIWMIIQDFHRPKYQNVDHKNQVVRKKFDQWQIVHRPLLVSKLVRPNSKMI